MKLAILARVASALLGRNRGGGEIPVPHPTKEQQEYYSYRIESDRVWSKRAQVLERALRLAERAIQSAMVVPPDRAASYVELVLDIEKAVHERLPLPDPPDFTEEVS